MAARRLRSAGIPGAAVFLVGIGAYLMYAGVRGVPLVEGARSLIRGEEPEGKTASSRVGEILAGSGLAPAGSSSGIIGDLGLEGNAAAALPKFKMLFPTMVFYGRADRPDNPSSDHPKGKAIDAMTSDPAVAERVIALFLQQSGAKYWIWNRQIASRERLWVRRRYTGEGAGGNPHTDHVHLSFY